MSNETPEPSPQDLRLAELLEISNTRAFTDAEIDEIKEFQRQARKKGPTMRDLFAFMDAHCDPWWRTPGMK